LASEGFEVTARAAMVGGDGPPASGGASLAAWLSELRFGTSPPPHPTTIANAPARPRSANHVLQSFISPISFPVSRIRRRGARRSGANGNLHLFPHLQVAFTIMAATRTRTATALDTHNEDAESGSLTFCTAAPSESRRAWIGRRISGRVRYAPLNRSCRDFRLRRLDEAASPRDGGAASVTCAGREQVEAG
jgi:hypothetical protein